MESKAKFLGHPLHTMLVVFPLGLLITSVGFDLVGAVTSSAEPFRVSYWILLVGVITGVIAAVPGIIDYLNISNGTRAKRIGLMHGLGNVVVIGVFGLSWWLRFAKGSVVPESAPLALSFLAFLIGGVTAWLGGELVGRLGVGVDKGANLNAPNSLSGRAATDTTPRERTAVEH